MKPEANSLRAEVADLKSDLCCGIEPPGGEVVRFIRVHPVVTLASVVVAGAVLGQSHTISRGMIVASRLALRWALQSVLAPAR